MQCSPARALNGQNELMGGVRITQSPACPGHKNDDEVHKGQCKMGGACVQQKAGGGGKGNRRVVGVRGRVGKVWDGGVGVGKMPPSDIEK